MTDDVEENGQRQKNAFATPTMGKPNSLASRATITATCTAHRRPPIKRAKKVVTMSGSVDESCLEKDPRKPGWYCRGRKPGLFSRDLRALPIQAAQLPKTTVNDRGTTHNNDLEPLGEHVNAGEKECRDWQNIG